MFKKSKIATVTLALMSVAVAQNVRAVALDESGTAAQVLIFPYYNVNNNFQTSFNIRNVKNEYKAIKVRFRESKYSNDVLDFNVYLSPYDHFSFTMNKDSQGKARLTTTDRSCTYPAIPTEGVPLRGSFFFHTTDQDAWEGYVEVIEMGVVVNGTPAGSTTTLYDGIKHIQVGDNAYAPKDCSVVNKAWKSGYFTQGGALADTVNFSSPDRVAVVAGYYSDESADNPTPGIPDNITAPTGGLRGFLILLDVAKGAANAVEATGIRNYQNDYAQHYKSDDPAFQLLPSFASGNDYTSVVARDDGRGSITNVWSPVKADWALSDPFVAPNSGVPGGNNPFPIADVLAATGFHNEYFINPAYRSATDWVVVFPMRKHGLFNGYRFGGSTDRVPATQTTPEINRVLRFTANNPAVLVDVKFNLDSWNREETQLTQADTFDREVNVLTFYNQDNPTSVVIGSAFAKKILLKNGFVEGWAKLTFNLNENLAALGNTNGWLTNQATAKTIGVPVLGFALIRGGDNLIARDAMGEAVPHTLTRFRGD